MKHLILLAFAAASLVSFDALASDPSSAPKNKTVERVRRKHRNAQLLRTLTFRTSPYNAYAKKTRF